jgi:hypothetical protein
MSSFGSRLHFGWIALAYATVIALVLYPALHETLGLTITLWNCVPPTLGLIVIVSALGKSRRRLMVAATFAVLATASTAFFAGAWALTPLDTNPHSSMTVIVFIFSPIWSLLVATLGSGLTWFATRTPSS